MKLYTAFHLNLMYSSIEEEERREVIHKCYWPLFNLADHGFPIGIEAPGITLEIINNIDPKWINTLNKYIVDGKIEFIGSGYSQIIGPLVPAKVNDWNQKRGLEVYKKLLGIKPKVALVNEMAYSAGVLEHYINNGYDVIIMEWNNPRAGHPEWGNNWRYYPQKAKGCGDKTISLIWADSIAFQKFQRYVHREFAFDEYINYLKSHSGSSNRFFPLYSNDVEIFNYRPRRYHTESDCDKQSEWKRIIDLYTYLKKQDWCDFIFPSDVLKGLNYLDGGLKLRLESPEQPIPVKKQEKYNINRWALTGRDDLGINTKCYQIYHGLIDDKSNNPEDWKELCYLWSSDFRTHITENRWENYQKRLENACGKWVKKEKKDVHQKTEKLSMNDSDYSYTETDRFLTIENDEIQTVLNKHKGLTIKECVFKKISAKSLFGTLEHGYFEDISLGADFFSGHAIIERLGQHKITDLGEVQPEVFKSDSEIVVSAQQKLENVYFSNEISINQDGLSIKKSIRLRELGQAIIRPLNLTFNPEAWDNDTLYFETNNGGKKPERFQLARSQLIHSDIYSSLISARHGLGNTEYALTIGDKEKTITFYCDMNVSALIPTIIFLPSESNKYFFRVQYSAGEIDETLKKVNSKGKVTCCLTINCDT